jgi:cysteinyl-tRNA synthetase
MGTKYLGEQFDIHGGGMDLLFPHHESEIAQSVAANNKMPVCYWLHNNMVTINGQKMGKSLGNAVSLEEFFSGSHPLIDKPYSPMTIRFFILQAQYRSTLDFSNEALQASEKGLRKLMEGLRTMEKLQSDSSQFAVRSSQSAVGSQRSTVNGQDSGVSSQQSDHRLTANSQQPVGESAWDVAAFVKNCYDAMNDDFNSPVVIAQLFDAARMINLIKEKKEKFSDEDTCLLNETFRTFMMDILGLLPEEQSGKKDEIISGLMDTIIEIRQEVRAKKDFTTSDQIRDKLQKINIHIKDGKDGATWEITEE